MELLLHYVWQQGLFDQTTLTTTRGESVEVVRRGMYNRHAGADFLGAHLRIGGQLWVGDVEMHEKASDWVTHGHGSDTHYNSVVLHVVECADVAVCTQAGAIVPQVVVAIPSHIRRNYEALLSMASYPPCHMVLSQFDTLSRHHFLTTLAVERMEEKTARIGRYLSQTGGDWERTLFVTLARAFGFGVNGEAFEKWALAIAPSNIGKHRDDPALIEAYFLGTAGLLDETAVSPNCRDEAYQRLAHDFRFLTAKFGLVPLDPSIWRFLRLRPQNFPHVRISQLVQMYCKGQLTVARLLSANTLEATQTLLSTAATPYWQSHYRFGHPTQTTGKALQRTSLDRLVINAVVPFLFAYGRAHGKEELCERAMALLEALRPENDHIVRSWRAVGLVPENAADTQALNHLYTNYCTLRRCLACRIGRRYIDIIH